MICPQCKSQIPNDSAFCPRCGYNMKQGSSNTYPKHSDSGPFAVLGSLNSNKDDKTNTNSCNELPYMYGGNGTQTTGASYTQNGWQAANAEAFSDEKWRAWLPAVVIAVVIVAFAFIASGRLDVASKKQWNEWSQWQEAPVIAGENCQVESKTQYRCREIRTNTNYSDWGEWSDWSAGRVYPTETLDVQSKEQYEYTGYYYTCELCDFRHYRLSVVFVAHCRKIHVLPGELAEDDVTPLSKYLTNSGSSLEEALASARLKRSKTVIYSDFPLDVDTSQEPYKIMYNGLEYSIDPVEPSTVTVYRTRSRKSSVEITFSAWSGYSDSVILSTDTREVDTRVVYRYRTR